MPMATYVRGGGGGGRREVIGTPDGGRERGASEGQAARQPGRTAAMARNSAGLALGCSQRGEEGTAITPMASTPSSATAAACSGLRRPQTLSHGLAAAAGGRNGGAATARGSGGQSFLGSESTGPEAWVKAGSC